MFKNLLPSLRKKSFVMEDLPETISVPSYGNKPEVPALNIEIATVDDIAFAIRELDQKSTAIYTQISSLRRLHDLARRRGAVGTDKVADIFEGEV